MQNQFSKPVLLRGAVTFAILIVLHFLGVF